MSSQLQNGRQQFVDLNGRPLINANVHFYAVGTEDPLDTFQDAALTIPNTNPVVTDSRGQATIWGTGSYRQIVIDSTGATIWDQDIADVTSGLAAQIAAIIANYAAPTGATLVGALRNGTPITVQQGLDVLYYGIANVKSKEFAGGAPDNGVADALAAFNAALASGAKRVFVPDPVVSYFLSAGITIPRGVTLEGASMLPGSPPAGTTLLFANSVAVCVTLNGGTTGTGGGTSSLRRMVINRSGTAPAGSTGVKIQGQYNSIMEDVFSLNHDNGFYWLGQGGTGSLPLANGIASSATRIYTGKISDTHFVVDSWPELRVSQGRAGMNGTGDLVGNAFVKITSPTGGGGGAGPNTIIFNNFQFNQGQVGPLNWLSFVNNQANVGNQVIYQFNNCHIEGITGAYIKADSASPYIQKLTVSNTVFNTRVPLFDFPSTLEIDAMKFMGCNIAASTINPTLQYLNGLTFCGCSMSSVVATFAAPANKNWNLNLIGNDWGGSSSVAISGSGWNNALILDIFSFSATFTDTSGSPNINRLTPNQLSGLWVPQLQIGGATTGIVASTATGNWQLVGRVLTLNYKIILTSKGALTGSLTIGGLPFPPGGNALDGSCGPIAYVQNFVGLTGAIMAYARNSATLGILQAGAAGTSAVTDANLANNSYFYGAISYFI